MENIILALIITFALLFITFKVKKLLNGLAQPEFGQNCSACESCCNSACKTKKINLEGKEND
jgi:hypothetical protein